MLVISILAVALPLFSGFAQTPHVDPPPTPTVRPPTTTTTTTFSGTAPAPLPSFSLPKPNVRRRAPAFAFAPAASPSATPAPTACYFPAAPTPTRAPPRSASPSSPAAPAAPAPRFTRTIHSALTEAALDVAKLASKLHATAVRSLSLPLAAIETYLSATFNPPVRAQNAVYIKYPVAPPPTAMPVSAPHSVVPRTPSSIQVLTRRVAACFDYLLHSFATVLARAPSPILLPAAAAAQSSAAPAPASSSQEPKPSANDFLVEL
ncbi:hypothetical protein BOTBODRAFT_180881 [Botryobasidium botryosum FD-172 SS1]|uniref:Uncharacterized protein n=1 Tax=Botryobasidium botryosum (strain FD-172 SS1) TaxID=930990 RepID=A0A067LVM1_BOTB1|nr:hypothetical protein BOTBODRAFT_180881 [Botryobasidium botryosum FD-172 SS1]